MKDLCKNLMLKLMSEGVSDRLKKKKNRRQGAKIVGHKDIKARKKEKQCMVEVGAPSRKAWLEFGEEWGRARAGMNRVFRNDMDVHLDLILKAVKIQ